MIPSIRDLIQEFPELGKETRPIDGNGFSVLNVVFKCLHRESVGHGIYVLFVIGIIFETC